MRAYIHALAVQCIHVLCVALQLVDLMDVYSSMGLREAVRTSLAQLVTCVPACLESPLASYALLGQVPCNSWSAHAAMR